MDTGLRRLRYFQILAAELNFRRTADKLNITQPALSRAIAQLEEDVGVRLFERTNRQVQLSLAGRTFAAGCERVLDSLDSTIDHTLRVARGYAGTLVIGYTDTIIAGRLPDLIKSFRDLAPDIHIRLSQVYTTQQRKMLEDGRLDMGMMTGPVEGEGLRTIDIQADRFVAIFSRDHPLAGRPAVDLAELGDYPFVLGDLDHWEAYHAHLFKHCERAGIRPEIVQTAPESRAIIGLVTCGLGVSVMPESLVRTVDPRIEARPVRDIGERLITQAVWFPAQAQPALQRFVEHLARHDLSAEGTISADGTA